MTASFSQYTPVSANTFWWATGIEDTFVPQVDKTRRRLDLYELQQHYARWKEDLDLAASLGISMMRYGIPWYRVNPAKGQYDWRWTDQVLNYMVTRLGINPIIDFVHYGCPLWLNDQFANPDYPSFVADYVSRFAERYQGLGIRFFTPLNEPYVNAQYCGLMGRWPPYLKGDSGFVFIMNQLCRGIIAAVRALRHIVSESIMVHVEAAGMVLTNDQSLKNEARFRNEQRMLMFDLVQGRVDSSHSLQAWLSNNGMGPEDFDWFHDNRIDIDVMGLNYYPDLSISEIRRQGDSTVTLPMWGGAACLREVILNHWKRYQRPIFITETSTNEKCARRSDWLRDSVREVQRLKREGVQVVGYTWWPMYDLVNWDYREGAGEAADYLEPMGLWALVPDDTGQLNRVETKNVQQFRSIVRTGIKANMGG